MTAPATDSAPPAPASRPGYRDRLLARYTAAAEERIEKAQAAAIELGHTSPVPWEDIRAVYTRPSRTTLQACRELLGKALGVALIGAFLWGLLVMIVLAVGIKQTTAAQKAPTTKASAEAEQRLVRAAGKKAGQHFVMAFTVGFLCSACGRGGDKWRAAQKGYVGDGDQVVTEALDVLPALAELASAPAGPARTKALADVHGKVSALMNAVTTNATTAAGMYAKYVADQGRLREHGQKVRTAFTEKLGDLVEDRERAARKLGTMALTVAGRHAQAAYGALLDTEALPAEPGPDVVDVKPLHRVFAIAGVAAAGSLVLAPAAGAEGAGLLFIPIAVFALAAFLAAAYTRNLHLLGRVFAMFGRGGGDGGGGML
ncbi:hypothetical protein GCM10010406_41340 [Streptomyces thermolineatus]|uniref:Integral membrane protein n=1 Tax=Streptomyces thermolineatus TaxID=44033 RepID=A0ABN3MG12_9ACTN